jgi:hypothetical protein
VKHQTRNRRAYETIQVGFVYRDSITLSCGGILRFGQGTTAGLADQSDSPALQTLIFQMLVLAWLCRVTNNETLCKVLGEGLLADWRPMHAVVTGGFFMLTMWSASPYGH